MDIIVGGRQTGKTTKLIQLAAEAEANGEVSYIVCGNQRQAYNISQRAKEMGLYIGFPLVFDEFLRHEYAGEHIKHFYVDNAENLIRMLSWGVPITAITINKD